MDLSQRVLQSNGKLFFKFRIFDRKLNIFQKIYQWIRLNELYKLMEGFFQISNSFSNFWPKNIFFFKRIAKREY